MIGKGASLILQIILVVAAVLLFSYFDPFGLLSPTKLKLKNTPIQVKSIKEIGELITAEYYGEVIASLDEVVNVKQDSVLIQFNRITNDLHEDFVNAIDELRLDTLKRDKDIIYRHFIEEYFDPGDYDEFEPYLYYISEQIKGNNYKTKELTKTLNDRDKKVLIKKLYRNQNWYYEKLKAISTTEFQSVKEEVIVKKDKKTYKRSRLVIIGRGWVKAGFDFSEFSEKNFRYNTSRNTIHFIGLQPDILSATINPWFIPEEGVEGFEFLIAERGARMNPKYVNLVKKRCLDKLQLQALEKDIMKKAQENAESNMKAFFSLLLDEEVKSVSFHTDLLDYTFEILKADTVIRNEEFITIDHALLDYYNQHRNRDYRFNKMNAFLDSLHTLPTEIYGQPVDLNAYSSLLFHIVRNRRIDSADLVRVSERNKNQLLDSLWQSHLFKEKSFDTAAFHNHLKNDADQLELDFERLSNKLEMVTDSGYFKRAEQNADSLLSNLFK